MKLILETSQKRKIKKLRKRKPYISLTPIDTKPKVIKKRKDLPYIICYTDGSYSSTTQAGSWCSYMECDGTSSILFGSEPNTTVNRMELNAVVQALQFVDMRSHIHIFSDSAYVVNSISKRWVHNWAKNGWRTFSGTKVLNRDLWIQILELLQRHKVTIEWVKGHSGNPTNELCDSIAQYWRSYRYPSP